MKFYLAAAFGRQSELKEYAEALTSLGHTDLSAWLLEDPACDDGKTVPDDAAAVIEAVTLDIEGIQAAELFIAFTEPPGGPSRGGRHVEYGFMLARIREAKLLNFPPPRLLICGPVENHFHTVDVVERFDDWPSLYAQLAKEANPIAA